MDFIFGTRLYDGQYCEFLKTQGESFTDLTPGVFSSHVISNPLMTITHTFRVIRKFKEDQDLQGNFCTWYYIDNHTQDVDRTPGINMTLTEHNDQLAEQSEVIDDIIIELLNRLDNEQGGE